MGWKEFLISFIFVIVFISLMVLFVYYYNLDISKEQTTQCNELKNLGFKTYLEHNPVIRLWGKEGDVCYVYLEDGRRVVYSDIKNNINVNLARQ